MAHQDMTLTCMSRTIEALRAEIEALRHDSRHDPLTGLGNRRLLEERSSARGGRFVAIDLDGFKRAQDAHPDGHAYGDIVLRDFAAFLLRMTSFSDDRVACRVGGDEFTVCCSNLFSARVVARRIAGWRYDDVTASTGIGENREEADLALYAAKKEKLL